MGLPDAVLATTARWMSDFAADWRGEVPIRIHSSAIDSGGAPEYDGAFTRWLTRSDKPDDPRDQHRNPENRLRITRAMRALRRVAPREYEVVYRVMILGETVEQAAKWLNERAIRGGHPERYTRKDTVAIIVSGVDKLRAWY